MHYCYRQDLDKALLHVQMVVSANGHHKVPFVDLVIAGKVGWKVSHPSAERSQYCNLSVHARSAVLDS